MIKKLLGVIFIGGAMIAILGKYTLYVLLFFLGLWVIRVIADIFWWGRDKEKW